MTLGQRISIYRKKTGDLSGDPGRATGCQPAGSQQMGDRRRVTGYGKSAGSGQRVRCIRGGADGDTRGPGWTHGYADGIPYPRRLVGSTGRFRCGHPCDDRRCHLLVRSRKRRPDQQNT